MERREERERAALCSVHQQQGWEVGGQAGNAGVAAVGRKAGDAPFLLRERDGERGDSGGIEDERERIAEPEKK
jgi:hypothetical protein